MSHARKQLLDALVGYVTGLDTTGDRVFQTINHKRVLQRAQLPCLLVYRAPEGTEEAEHDGGGRLQRECKLIVKALVEGVDSEDQLDEIAAEVETAVPRTLGSLAFDCIPSETRFMIGEQATDAERASVEIEFSALYRTRIGEPETLL